MIPYWLILIKIYNIFPILYFRYIISWINTVTFSFYNTFLFQSLLKDEAAFKILASPTCAFTCSIVFLPANRFPNKLAPNVPNNMLKNSPFCSFASFLIASLTPFIHKPDSSRHLIIFITSFISSLKIINVVVPDPNVFLWITASVADAAIEVLIIL